ncbi:hypothetical protein PG994_008723, partial [Apiospora phragmitis]
IGGFVAVEDDDTTTTATAIEQCSSSSSAQPPASPPRKKILGHVSLRRVGPHSTESGLWNACCLWGVSRLAIDPAVQKRGVGGRLMDYVEREARREGKTLVLGVLDKDVAAIRMYEGRGWVRFGQEEGFAGRDGRLWTMYYYGLSYNDALPSSRGFPKDFLTPGQ